MLYLFAYFITFCYICISLILILLIVGDFFSLLWETFRSAPLATYIWANVAVISIFLTFSLPFTPHEYFSWKPGMYIPPRGTLLYYFYVICLVLLCIINLVPLIIGLLFVFPFYKRYEKKKAERKELLRQQWLEKREQKRLEEQQRLEEQKRLEAEAAATTELMLEPLNEPMN